MPGEIATAEIARAAESARLSSLEKYGILDTPAEAAFDRLTKLAARLFEAPICLVSLVDDKRQWIKSCYGTDLQETSRDLSFCSLAIERKDEVMVVSDTALDARFRDNPFVTEEPFVRFYAGAPLIGRDGSALGSLCVLDTKPRQFDEVQCALLQDLAIVVVDELEMRLAAQRLGEEARARKQAQKALQDAEIRFQSAFEMSATGMALVTPQGNWLRVNNCLCRMLGYSSEALLQLRFQDITYPEDLAGDLQLVERLLAGEFDSYELEKRFIRGDGKIIWTAMNVALVRDEIEGAQYFVAQVQDISARHEVEAELRQSEARKSAILETALDCIITIDAQSRILEWNPAAERTFGYSREQAFSRPLHELIVPPELRDKHVAGLAHYMKTGEGPALNQRLELPAIRYDGKRIMVELAIVPIPGAVPPLFTGHLRDISERRASEERLRLLESVAVNANDAILITEAEPIDLPGPRILYANKAFVEMSGYSLEEILGQTPRILQGKGTLDESRAKIRAALQKWKPIVIELLNYKKDGTSFWVELSITPVANEKGWFTHWVSVQRDITERKAIEDALQESEGRYGRIATNVPGMVYQFVLRTDGSFHFPFVSEGCQEIYGLEPAQVMADAQKILQYVHPSDAQSFHDSIVESAQTLEAWEWEGRIELPGQKIKWIRGTSRAKREENGETIWDGILFDITQRKTYEEVLQKSKIEAELAREEAERANLAKSEFLSRMSHELRTPLNAILGFGQLLEMSQLEAEDTESAEQIVNAGRHLLALINEVLDIARIESGQLSLSPEPVSVAEIGLETLDLVRPLARARDLILDDTTIRSSELWVRADRQRLKQVLLNLLSNAVKYNSPKGHISMSCEVRETGRVRIDVRDNGAGIAPGMRERLFTAFDRLGAENSDVEGTGVGLALSKRLAEAMGGTLDFQSFGDESEGGQGSLFWIELPGAQKRSGDFETLPAPPEAIEAHSTKLVVLYIEDNPSNLQLVQKLLAHRPEVRLLTAVQGSMGIELARQHCPDLILLDINLPDISGTDVLKLLRADESTRAIAVAVVSADATPRQIERMMEAGAEQYLTKPFDVREFLELLDDSLAKNGFGENGLARQDAGASTLMENGAP